MYRLNVKKGCAEIGTLFIQVPYRSKLLNLQKMDTPRFVEETVNDKKLAEVDSCKLPATCACHSTNNGLDNCCKSGAFMIPLCIVI